MKYECGEKIELLDQVQVTFVPNDFVGEVVETGRVSGFDEINGIKYVVVNTGDRKVFATVNTVRKLAHEHQPA